MQNRYHLNLDPYSIHMKAVKLVGKNKTVLDIGCATGYMAERLEANGCQVYGIELDEEAGRLASRYCVQVAVGDLEALGKAPFEGKQYDAILLLDILEHLREPLVSLRKLVNCSGPMVIW